MISRVLKLIKQIYEINMYNRLHNTIIESRHASLMGNYGKRVRIGKGTYVDDNSTIGDYSYVNRNSSVENCIIGKYCSISSGVYVNPYEHDYHLITTHPFIRNGISDNNRKKVIIGNDVLISLNVVITSGVTIGDGAVIGAGAVVTRDVKPYEIVGGVPAKHIKWRFDQEKINRLLEVKWWDWSEEKRNRNMDFFWNKTDLIK